MSFTPTILLAGVLAVCSSCAFHSEPLPLPATFYAMETAVDDSSREEAFLGLEVELNASEDMFSLDVPPGVRIIGVEESSPAAEAGFAVGDILLKFDGRATDDPQRLTRLLEGVTEAGSVELEFQRGSKVLAVNAELTMRSTSAARYLYHVDRGLLRAAFRDTPDGLPEIVELDEESPLREAGLKAGDVIVRFQGEDPGSAGEFLRRVRLSVQPGDPMPLIVRSANERQRAVKAEAWSPGSVMVEAGIWPLFNWTREIGEDRGQFAIGTLLITDLFRYRRDGHEGYYSILSLITWETGELILEEAPMPPELNQ
jgi:membrane-associated protease RseP (regulator of RpoE activity)